MHDDGCGQVGYEVFRKSTSARLGCQGSRRSSFEVRKRLYGSGVVLGLGLQVTSSRFLKFHHSGL